VVSDHAHDPEVWLDLDTAEIRRLLFTPGNALAEGEERVALKTVHINKCPALAPMSVLNDDTITRYAIDLDACARHREKLLGDSALEQKLRQVFAEPEHAEVNDPDHMLYGGGFFSDHDKNLMLELRETLPDSLAALSLPFQDPRLEEMLFRYRARNFPDTLDAQEQAHWRQWCAEQLQQNPNGVGLAASDYFSRIDELIAEKPEHADLLVSLREYGQRVCTSAGIKV
jgi:exodeoxyribonuclease-1